MASASAPPMINLDGVTKRFGNFVAVHSLSLTVKAGEFLTLLGPSGCGKTTLLRMLSGFETPTAGRVEIDGEDVTFTPPYRRNVNQVFQSYALFPHLTVAENIGFGLRMQGVPKTEIGRRVASAVELVALQGLEERRPDQLSGGQRQRVALARAIVPEPKVLLLDEPLSALDAKLRRTMQLELKRLQRQLGITTVFVTHDQEEAITMSDRIAVMNAGRIEQLGAADEVYLRPATRFVADFIGEANLLEVQLVSPGLARTRFGVGLPVPPSVVDSASGSLLVSIRPEKIAVELLPENLSDRSQLAGPTPEAALLEATVSDAIFQGATTRVTLRLPDESVLVALLANASGVDHLSRLRRGQAVLCRIAASDLVRVERR